MSNAKFEPGEGLMPEDTHHRPAHRYEATDADPFAAVRTERTGPMSSTDDWINNGTNILEPELLAKIRNILEQQPIILEHRLYRASSAPLRLVFEEYEEFLDHLKSRARPGDNILVWGYSDLCRDNNMLVNGKYPAHAGRVPRGGAY